MQASDVPKLGVVKAHRKAGVAAPKRPSQSDFARFLRGAAGRSNGLIDQLSGLELTPREWGDAFKLLLNDGHAEAWMLGRQRAGDLTGLVADDLLIGIGYADTQADYLLRFIDDLSGTRYIGDDGFFVSSAIKQRANLYIQTMRGTSGAAFVAASDLDAGFDWELGGAEDHCDDCPYLASQNPWDASTLYAYPGDGNTACLGNCKCRLVRTDGIASFGPVDL